MVSKQPPASHLRLFQVLGLIFPILCSAVWAAENEPVAPGTANQSTPPELTIDDLDPGTYEGYFRGLREGSFSGKAGYHMERPTDGRLPFFYLILYEFTDLENWSAFALQRNGFGPPPQGSYALGPNSPFNLVYVEARNNQIVFNTRAKLGELNIEAVEPGRVRGSFQFIGDYASQNASDFREDSVLIRVVFDAPVIDPSTLPLPF